MKVKLLIAIFILLLFENLNSTIIETVNNFTIISDSYSIYHLEFGGSKEKNFEIELSSIKI